MLKELLLGIIILISLCIMILSLLMSPHSNSFSGALVGSSDLDLFKVSKERGFRKFTK
ncbi:preprotein translocase subunit SecG [Sulfolobus sp. A20-N-F6]|nr:preprotein translocase subunit SecG [Sulfolobus sp. A20-N-F8]TRM83216.1 preprotein translocase subunit SecG [Sulfolobus sp. A20-N-F6]TRM83259.1 preprotein translocase subunit SecG [Sulfolobus sp. A20-N-G8]